MRLASEADFYNGPLYTHYRHHEGFVKRARLFANFPEPVLIVGCAFGYLVEELQRLNRDAWGVDASSYAIENRASERVVLGNILDLDHWNLPREFGTVITEDLLPNLTNEEALVAAANCQQLSPVVVHLVTEQGQADLNYHPCIEWMNMTHQPTISLEGM